MSQTCPVTVSSFEVHNVCLLKRGTWYITIIWIYLIHPFWNAQLQTNFLYLDILMICRYETWIPKTLPFHCTCRSRDLVAALGRKIDKKHGIYWSSLSRWYWNFALISSCSLQLVRYKVDMGSLRIWQNDSIRATPFCHEQIYQTSLYLTQISLKTLLSCRTSGLKCIIAARWKIN